MSQDKGVEADIEINSIGKRVRKIRSYVLREGRLTKGQQRAMDELFPQLGLEFQRQAYDLEEVFGRSSAKVLEIGFGMGKSLAEQASCERDKDFVGIEVHKPGVGACLLLAEEYELTNLRVIHHDAVEIIDYAIADKSLDKIQIFFPDPWHKKKHHKRRIVQTEFCQKLHKKLKTGGILHLATDWENYAEHMLEVLNPLPEFENLSKTGDYVPRPDSRPLTKFEQRGHRLGHGVWDLHFVAK
ncbi:tRNA (guanosine(46)-N7)-methyltransferase TrmB [Kangiella sp. TOML190]|uniref:tRNA (guanosine(46)-N7)-methyltransferase TrmB n=1 Tax=Kangiella sp. TOML190 TaxID=2931351 RepID=UPI00203E09CE|nr:tRNA (guanosine(46)-N7)-methyltransferase TrmB [Kangiella sp. TOML190]